MSTLANGGDGDMDTGQDQATKHGYEGEPQSEQGVQIELATIIAGLLAITGIWAP